MIVGTFRVPHGALSLEHTFREVPRLEVETDRIAAHSTSRTMPCLWVAGADDDAFLEALAGDPSVDETVESRAFDDETYVEVEWADDVTDRIDSYVDEGGVILSARADSEGWRVQFRFADREQFDRFRESMSERDHPLDCLNLTEPDAPRQTTVDLTPDQRDALVTAKERGYYRVPREITTRELADVLETSHQAASELLRRGVANLIDSTLTTRDETGQ